MLNQISGPKNKFFHKTLSPKYRFRVMKKPVHRMLYNIADCSKAGCQLIPPHELITKAYIS